MWADHGKELTQRRVRALIERLVKTIEPSARLLAFGSSQNSFGLRNSGMSLYTFGWLLEIDRFRESANVQIWILLSSLTTRLLISKAAIWCK